MEAAPFDHAAVLLACARGDERAFHQLYDHEAPHMLALCRRLMPADAEGLLHDTLALVWRHASHYDAALGSARAWIYSVLRHVFLGRRSRLGAAQSSPQDLPVAGTVRGSIAALATGSQPQAFEAVAQAYLHGEDYRGIARLQGRSEAEVRRLVQTALKELLA